MARKKSTVTEEELATLNTAIRELADTVGELEADGGARQYLGEDGLRRLVELIADGLKAKQDTLTQGENITIKDNVISAEIDLKDYATKEDLEGKADAFEAGTGLELKDGVLNCTVDPTLFVVVASLPESPEEGDENRIFLVPAETTGSGNVYKEYLWVDGAWEQFGELTATTELEGYLPLTGGTVTGNLNVQGNATLTDVSAERIDVDGSVNVEGKITGERVEAGDVSVDDSIAADTITADTVNVGSVLKVTPEDEEDLADVKCVLGLNSQNWAVKIPPSQFNTGGSGAVVTHGAYIAYIDTDNINRICKAEDWYKISGDAQGVAVVAGGRCILIDVDNQSALPWASSSGHVSGLTDFYNFNTALRDFEGKAWGKAYSEAYPTDLSSAMGWCRNHSTDYIGGGWWLPSVGEWNLIRAFLDEVNDAVNYIGASSLTGNYWASTEYGGDMAFYYAVATGTGSFTSKTGTSYQTRAITDWIWVE